VAGAARQLTGAANRGSAGGKPARLGSTAPAVSESVRCAGMIPQTWPRRALVEMAPRALQLAGR
jgi:hypothetical protein